MSLKYRTGKGFIRGIPARDLTDEEVEKFGGAPILVQTGLYYVDFDEIMRQEQTPEAEQQEPAAPEVLNIEELREAVTEKPKRKKKSKNKLTEG